MDHPTLNRREALRTLAAGAVAAASSTFWVESLIAQARAQAHAHTADAALASQEWVPKVLNAHQNDTLIALTELIIPETETPGAKAARVNRFVDRVLSEAKAAERDSFLRGLSWLDQRSTALFGKDVLTASTADQTSLLTKLSDEGNKTPEDKIGVEFFQAIKSMTISGYYATEIGLRQELGDDGMLFLPQFKGCDHPEHQG